MGTTNSIEQPVIFFDGVCNLCNTSVQFVLRKDKRNKYLFSSLQSDYAQTALPGDMTTKDALQSIVLKENEKIWSKSSAILTIAKNLSGLWPILYIFIIVPKFIRDWVYDIVAKNRYRWFGKKDQCMVPSQELKSRFID